jgi:hypothetical protein
MLAMIVGGTAYAEDQPQICYAIWRVPQVDNGDIIALKANKCTGETWFLTRLSERDGSGNVVSTTYKWIPIDTTNLPKQQK